MLKLSILFAVFMAACAVEDNTSSLESLSCGECNPPPPPPGPECTDKGEIVDLDAQEANLDHDDGKVTFCHATGSEKNPFVVITTDVNGCHGHEDHYPGDSDGDIFPTQGCAD